ncbi:hypothetical protein C8R46DRAFT_1268145 [Mycena filopes]|nr:hypothetical protein C8R46DRAFT_1268145 [Mycena filopes]
MLAMTPLSALLCLIFASSVLPTHGGVIPGSGITASSTLIDAYKESLRRTSDSDSDTVDPNDAADTSYRTEDGSVGDDTLDNIDPDAPPPTSDRVLRSGGPAPEWQAGVKPANKVCIDGDDDELTEDYDYCDNGGSGNCLLSTDDFSLQSVSTRRDEMTPRMITGNGTYKFLPGESMVVRRIAKRATVSPSAPILQLVFNCDPRNKDSLPEVCDNMCFGLNCNNIQNRFTREDNKSQCSANRKKNPCGAKSPNLCSPKYSPTATNLASTRPGTKLSCDEFPFASTKQATAATGKTAARCVEAVQNSRQGGKLGAFYRNHLKPNGVFEIAFDYGNGVQTSTDGPNTSKYCRPVTASLCTQVDTMQLS